MKIIQIMDNLSVGGGVNSFVYDLCYSLRKQGREVCLIGILDSEDNNEIVNLQRYGVKVICLGAKNKTEAIFNYIYKLRKVIIQQSKGEDTICNLHLKLSVLLGGIATIGLKHVKCIETYHSQYRNYTFEYNLMKRRISLYIPCSKSAGKEMHERFRVPDNKICVIPNGIVLDEIRKINPKKNHMGITFLSVGRLTRQKNYQAIIEAFNTLDSNNFNYFIIGKGEDEQVLKEQVTTEHIHFLEPMKREQVLSYTAGADMVCMPSLWEGRSIYMMEALALGRPMILSDIPSFREAVGENALENETYRRCEWGYLVKVDDAQAYGAALSHFIEHREIWGSMQKASISIAQKFDMSITADKYYSAYGFVCKETK